MSKRTPSPHPTSTVTWESLKEYARLKIQMWLQEPHEGHVFVYRGLPIKAVKTAFAGAVRRAGISHCTLHSCRHTFATRLVLAGVDLATVMQLMGHASISTTMKYAHPSPPHKREAVGRLDFNQQTQQPLDVVSLSE